MFCVNKNGSPKCMDVRINDQIQLEKFKNYIFFTKKKKIQYEYQVNNNPVAVN